MSDETFPIAADTVVHTLTELLRLQGQTDLVELLESATARIEQTDYDNYDGGIDIYTLFLNVPLRLYARIEAGIERNQESIFSKLKSTIKNTGRHVFGGVVIGPVLQEVVPTKARQTIPGVEVEHLWQANRLRLFLSHVAIHKIAVSKLKQELGVLGVSSFVAHVDIEPTLEWQQQIELALGSMHALAALLTPEYKQSKWTDQEVGVALGRGLLIIPVRLGLDPYGFIGKHQGLSGNLEAPGRMAAEIVGVLARQKATSVTMMESLVTALEKASSFASAKAVTSLIESLVGFTDTQLQRIEAAIKANSQVSDSFGVPARLQQIVKRNSPASKKSDRPPERTKW